MISVNTRVLNSPLSGVQRYLSSILSAADKAEYIKIESTYSGLRGHLWEQFCLPSKVPSSGVLWSPSNTGPLYLKARQVVTIHDTATLDHPEWTSRQFNLLYQFLLPRIAKRADKLIAISDFTKQRIVECFGVSEANIQVIKNGVDSRFFDISLVSLDFLQQKYRIPSQRFVLSVSSIEPRKNIQSLLKAWERIHTKLDDDIWLVLAGKQNSRIFADTGISKLPPRVHFTGFVADEDLPSLYSSALLFAYVSLYEGFGLPPLEAMASGAPVLTSNTTAIPEVVGSAALMVNPTSINEIADGMLALLDNERERSRLSLAGKIQATQFSWSDTAEKTFALLKSME